MSAPLHVVRAGAGPLVVLVHGSATDHATWSIQLASKLTEQVELVAYDRRGAGRSPAPDGRALTVEDHAADLVALLAELRRPALVVGSSMGGVVVLEAARRAPPELAAMVLLEPPLPPSDDAPDTQGALVTALDELAAREGGPAAAERFLRTVLGEAAWSRLPRAFQVRSTSYWPQIRGDCHALTRYRVRYATLPAIATPALLLAGDRSAPYFRPTIEALTAALPRARMDVVPGAGHMMQAEAPRGFHERLLGFAAEVGHLTA